MKGLIGVDVLILLQNRLFSADTAQSIYGVLQMRCDIAGEKIIVQEDTFCICFAAFEWCGLSPNDLEAYIFVSGIVGSSVQISMG